MNKISTIIPAYNRADLIGDTLNSILAQSVPPHEIIVIDDGSTDGTADVVASFGDLVRLCQQKNLGAGAARNLGFKHSTGDVIHFMDSDDLSSPNTYEVQLKALNNSSADFVYGPWVKSRIEGMKLECQKVVVQQRAVPSSPEMYKWVLRGWITVFQPCMLTRGLMERVGPYRTDLKPSEDTELLFRIAKSGARFVHTPETLVVYRVHPEGQISAGNSQPQREDWIRCHQAIQQQITSSEHLDWYTRFCHNLRKINAVNGGGVDQFEWTKRLNKSIPSYFFGVEKMTRRFKRIAAKLRRNKFGDNYTTPFQPAPMTESQIKLINKMGYQILDTFEK